MPLLRSIVLLILPLFVFAYPQYSQAIKKKKIYPLGEKIYKARCRDVQVSHLKNYAALLDYIQSKDVCQKLSPKYAEYIALYLWDTKKAINTQLYPQLRVDTKEKCPVCGMFLYKYPLWVSRIVYKDYNVSFDGVKDMMKYYFKHKKNIQTIYVQDYYSTKTLKAHNAFYVLGSDVYGPMGEELIPFETKQTAQQFLLDHQGKKMIRFSDITPKVVESLD